MSSGEESDISSEEIDDVSHSEDSSDAPEEVSFTTTRDRVFSEKERMRKLMTEEKKRRTAQQEEARRNRGNRDNMQQSFDVDDELPPDLLQQIAKRDQEAKLEQKQENKRKREDGMVNELSKKRRFQKTVAREVDGFTVVPLEGEFCDMEKQHFVAQQWLQRYFYKGKIPRLPPHTCTKRKGASSNSPAAIFLAGTLNQEKVQRAWIVQHAKQSSKRGKVEQKRSDLMSKKQRKMKRRESRHRLKIQSGGAKSFFQHDEYGIGGGLIGLGEWMKEDEEPKKEKKKRIGEDEVWEDGEPGYGGLK